MSIVLDHISKRFGGQWVVDNVSLEVADKQLFVLLGSSGSGKSTILRMIAGLTELTRGRILLHGTDVTHLPPQRRGTGFVFQNYSLFRHMTVAENMEFGLRIRKTPEEERTRRREQLLDLVGLAGFGARYAHQLSGAELLLHLLLWKASNFRYCSVQNLLRIQQKTRMQAVQKRKV